MTIGKMQLTWQLAVLALVTLQWLYFMFRSATSQQTKPKFGLRDSESNLLKSTAVFAIFWLVIFALPVVMFAQGPKGPTAIGLAREYADDRPKASCASLKIGMSASEVTSKMGQPDEIRPEEETRGPGAQMYIYTGPRCAVHVLSNKVDFID